MKALMSRAIFLLLLIALCAFGVWVGQKIGTDPGYVLFSYRNTTVEMSLWFFVGVSIVGVVALYFIYSIVHLIFSSKTLLTRWMMRKAQRKASQETTQGLLETLAGQWQQAQTHLLKAADTSDSPLLNYIAAARAAEALGQHHECDLALSKADEIAPHSFVLAITRAQIFLLRNQLTQAQALLEGLYQRHAKQPQVLDLLREVYYRSEQWRALQALLPALKKMAVVSADAFEALSQEVAIAWLTRAAHHHEGALRPLAHLNDVWRSLQTTQQHHPAVIAAYAQLLIEQGAQHDAERILKDTLHKTWHVSCVRLMGLISQGDAAKRLHEMESYLQKHPHDAVLLLTLGRICLHNQLWGKARTYFQESLHFEHTPETYAELGRLCAFLGEDELSASYFRQGLLLAQPLPDLSLPLLDNPKISPHLR